MLLAISGGKVNGYEEGQTPVLHLVSTAEAVAEKNLPFTYTEGHAEMSFSQFYEGLPNLRSRIDWEIMQAVYWNDQPADNDRKRRRQAEFLVAHFFPWQLFSMIGVINEAMRIKVLQRLAGADHKPEVVVHRNWYY